MLQNGRAVTFTLPLIGASDALNIDQRELAPDFSHDKLLSQFKGTYQRAPYFQQSKPLIEGILCHQERNLFRFLYHSIVATCKHLGIHTEIRVSSEIDIDHSLKGQDRIHAICDAVGAKNYVNAIGGMELYSKETFLEKGVNLNFIQSKPFYYEQFGGGFVPWLSIIDAMMFNPQDAIQSCISTNYELI